MATKNKATHQGTCQVCGRLQMLPAGVLAKHGYTTQWGFFSGVCQGAGHLPFEQDISLIEGMITWAKDTAARHIDTATALEVPTEGNVATCSVFVGHREAPKQVRYGFSEHPWVTGTIANTGVRNGWQVTVTEGRFAGLTLDVRDQGFQWDEINARQIELTPAMVASFNNADYAKRHHRVHAAKLTEYAAWQTKRIVGWVAHPEKLVPVKAEAEAVAA